MKIFIIFSILLLSISGFTQSSFQEIVDESVFLELDTLVIDKERIIDFAIIYKAIKIDVADEDKYIDYWSFFAKSLVSLNGPFEHIVIRYPETKRRPSQRILAHDRKMRDLLLEEMRGGRRIDVYADIIAIALMIPYDEY